MSGRDETIAAMVELHGEDGLSPTADGWRRILEYGSQRRLRVLNVLKFHDHVMVDGRQVTGREAYSAYLAENAAPFSRVGGRLIASEALFDTIGFHTDGDWDRFVLTEYPTGDALANMWLDADFVAAHRHREAGVSKSIAAFSTPRPHP
jgi:uncharacterized protein (DUF1330 family)